MVPGTPIIQLRFGFEDYEVSDTGTFTGGDEGRSTSAAENDGKDGTPCLERLLHPEGTSDSPIIRCFGDVYMLDITALFVKKMGTEIPQLFAPRHVIDGAAIFRSYLKTYAEKCMFDVFVH